jgi:hypothetical protein
MMMMMMMMMIMMIFVVKWVTIKEKQGSREEKKMSAKISEGAKALGMQRSC